MKKKALDEMANKVSFDLDKWEPTSTLHKDIPNKTYKLTLLDNKVNVEVSSDDFPAG